MTKSDTVSEAVQTRRSIRAFLDTPVDTKTILALLEKAARAPSGGNLQPWRIAVLNGDRMEEFRELMRGRMGDHPLSTGEALEYTIYPPGLKEPYRSHRFQIGEAMYGRLGIPRTDRKARHKWFANNFQFFGAPAAIFCFVDRQMGPPQWSDLGMFLQSFMLLAREEGLDTCPQECWAMYPDTVRKFCDTPEDHMLFCGVAIGFRDPEKPVNELVSEREATEKWVDVL